MDDVCEPSCPGIRVEEVNRSELLERLDRGSHNLNQMTAALVSLQFTQMESRSDNTRLENSLIEEMKKRNESLTRKVKSLEKQVETFAEQIREQRQTVKNMSKESKCTVEAALGMKKQLKDLDERVAALVTAYTDRQWEQPPAARNQASSSSTRPQALLTNTQYQDIMNALRRIEQAVPANRRESSSESSAGLRPRRTDNWERQGQNPRGPDRRNNPRWD